MEKESTPARLTAAQELARRKPFPELGWSVFGGSVVGKRWVCSFLIDHGANLNTGAEREPHGNTLGTKVFGRI